jgi:hypothetical protein
MGDESHCHGNIKTVLREEASHITLPVAFDTCFHTAIGYREDIQEAKDEEEDESSKNKLLTFHCVFP